jgi:ABC-type glycerol-3-phosphate transport system permease component
MANTAEKLTTPGDLAAKAPSPASIALRTSALNWAVRISVIVIVVLWLIPTLGLLISSFRDRPRRQRYAIGQKWTVGPLRRVRVVRYF